MDKYMKCKYTCTGKLKNIQHMARQSSPLLESRYPE